MGRRPIIEYREYNKFGFVRTRCQGFKCPSCEHLLNAGPDYQPRRCDNCGVKLDFSGIEYEDEQELGYVEAKNNE